MIFFFQTALGTFSPVQSCLFYLVSYQRKYALTYVPIFHSSYSSETLYLPVLERFNWA